MPMFQQHVGAVGTLDPESAGFSRCGGQESPLMHVSHSWLDSNAPTAATSDPHIRVIKTPDRRNGSRRRQDPGKGIIMNVARSFNTWLSYRRALAELGRLNSRALLDIGITREQIPVLARASAR